MDSTVLAKIKDDLIGTGIFLERDTYQLFKDWKPDGTFAAHREYPYSYGVHPLITNGTVDVLAETSIDGGRIVLILLTECKKADPKLKHWVFEPHQADDIRDMPYFLFTETHETCFTREYNFSALGYNTHNDYENCVNVFEFSVANGAISRNADKEMRAFFAIKQTNAAVPGIVGNVPSVSHQSGARIFYIPIVVTTANLWIARCNPQDIDKATGGIDKAKLNLEQKDWLLYQYPLTLHEQVTGRLASPPFNGLVRPDKRPTFVVNSVKLPDFITKLIYALKTYF